VAAAGALVLGGCSTWPDSLNPGSWFESADSNTNVKGPDRTYPKLSSVPDRPPPRDEAAQKQAEEQLKADRDAGLTVATAPPASGLAADRDAARYTDEDLRRSQAKAAAPPPPPPPPAAASAAAQPAQAQQAQTMRMELPRSVAPAAGPPPPAPAPSAASREAVRSEPVVQAPMPSTPPAAPAQQQAALPAAAPPPQPPAPPAAMAPEPPQVVAMAPIRSPGDPPAPATEAPLPSNLVWGPPPSDIALVRSGMAGPVPPSMAPMAPLRVGRGPVASVIFASGSARLGSNDEALLRQVAQQYLSSGGTISVVGHATQDTAGADVRRQIANFSVSMDRATVVAQALQRYGVPGEAIAISAQVDGVAMNDADGRRTDVFLR
jgi:outer membrane protein OmpA-like peptidoglycan-associated protein